MPKEPKAVKRQRTSPIPIPDTLSSEKARNQSEVNGKAQQTKKTVIEWHLDEIFKEAPEEDASDEERVVFDPDLSYYGIIILNQSIELCPAYFRDVWSKAAIQICADGGANHLSEFESDYNTGAHFRDPEEWTPSVIVGDFDSLEESVREFYTERGVPFVHSDDQNSTDFDKAIDEVKKFETDNEITDPLPIVTFGGLGGRVDQAFSLINQLYKSLPRSVFLISPVNLSFLLHPGENKIYASKELFSHTCGIIPIAGPAAITLRGFRWNLKNARSEFGSVVSTSNEISGDDATVITDAPVLFTIELNKTLHRGPRNL